MSAEWRVRQALHADAGEILLLQQGCTGAPQWTSDVWDGLLSANQGKPPLRSVFVAEDRSGIMGFAVVSRCNGTAEFETVAVRHEARRRGVGRALCEAAMAWAHRRGASAMELEVRASSLGARALYETLGFTEQGRRKAYYRDPVEDAVLMSAWLDDCSAQS